MRHRWFVKSRVGPEAVWNYSGHSMMFFNLNPQCVLVSFWPLCNVMWKWSIRLGSGDCNMSACQRCVSLHCVLASSVPALTEIFPSSNHREPQLQHKSTWRWPEVCVKAVEIWPPTALLALDIMLNTSTVARTGAMWSLSPGSHGSSWKSRGLSRLNDFN